MKLKNSILIESVDILGKLNNAVLPVRASYKLAKSLKEIESELVIFNEQKQKLINKYGKKDKDGNVEVGENGMIDIEDISGWSVEYNDLLGLEVDLNLLKIDANDLFESDFKISAIELSKIDYLIN